VTASTAQKLANIPEPEFRERVAVVKASGEQPFLIADIDNQVAANRLPL
jgi:hypothetical protein